ncbi:aminotransferase class IV [Streptomyces sp. NBC_01216]|uniref:aminotransferase class IV n=1 Tax=unclassified Streptomyces TaxID=2593676 RepID=UPI002E12F2C4|nr:aminotransferase class IV [Streptomyces sp. NBC_01216]
MTHTSPGSLRIETDGTPSSDPETLAALMSGYGHFTALQVRDGRARGLGLHLARLDRSTRELFGPGLDADYVRTLVTGALERAGRRDAAVRVYVHEGIRTTVTVREPFTPDPTPQSLMSVGYQRPAAHIKHLGGFGQRLHGDAARRAGFDDALLTAPDGEIAEAAYANIAFWDGTSVIRPSAPCLPGITMALLEPALGSVQRRVTRADLPGFRAAFLTSARSVTPVRRIDDLAFEVDEGLMRRVRAAYESVPREALRAGPGG